jgi:hypothetical protein
VPQGVELLADQNAPEMACREWEAHGGIVRRLRDEMPIDSADVAVATACVANGWVLLSCDGDFRRRQRKNLSWEAQLRAPLRRIVLAVQGPAAAVRLIDARGLILFEYERSVQANTSMLIEVADKAIRTWR